MADSFTFPNSPDVEITVTRGGRDATTGEVLSDKWVNFRWEISWEETTTGPDGEPITVTHTRVEQRGFEGP